MIFNTDCPVTAGYSNRHIEECTYNLFCFERCMHIFYDSRDVSEGRLWKIMDEAYEDWQDLDTSECLEEYIVDCIVEYFGKAIVLVLYDKKENEDEIQ